MRQSWDLVSVWHSNFNPRTHEECDASYSKPSNSDISFQSTHPWRVRPHKWYNCLNSLLFQSTHPWRVRRYYRSGWNMPINNFNPRTHEECDAKFDKVFSFHLYISIHAPMKSATFHGAIHDKFVHDFNPRTHEECDPSPVTKTSQNTIFQSTHPWRVRRFTAEIVLLE